MKKNVKKVLIHVPNEKILKRLNNTPSLKRLTRLTLKVGDNIEHVNHFQFSEQKRIYPIAGVTYKEL